MIELNLLPDEMKAKKKKMMELQEINLPFVPITVGFIACLIAIHILLIGYTGLQKNTLSKVNREWEAMAPGQKELNELRGRVRQIEAKVTAIDELTKNRVTWASVLNEIRDTIIQNVWISDISLQRQGDQKVLVIEGYVAGSSGEATSTVGKFLHALKGNAKFSSYFRDVKLDGIRSSIVMTYEVMRYRITAPLKEEK